MKIKLLNYIPLSNAVIAGRTAWQSFHKGGNYDLPTDNITEDDFDFLDRLFNKYKHISVAEHIWYTFEIKNFNLELMFKVKNEYNFFSIKGNDLIFSVNLRTIIEEINSNYINNSEIKNFYLNLIDYLPKNHQRLFNKNSGENIESTFHTISYENELRHRVELLYHYSIKKDMDFERRPHSFYTLRLSGFSRALLQELVRHDDLLAITVKSTRYTLKELKNESAFEKNEIGLKEANKYLLLQPVISRAQIEELNILKRHIDAGLSNDIVKYLLPESYRTECIITLNENNLKNLIKLRTDKSALREFQSLAKLIEKIINFK